MVQSTDLTGRSRRRRIWVRLAVLIALVVIIVGFRLVEEIGFDQKPGDRFTIVRVIDGDTVELKGGDKLRLLSIDTPEKGDLFYDEATMFVREIALGRVGRIEFSSRRRDKYGRLLGYLYIDSVFVNRQILVNGLGYLYLFKDTDIGREETNILLEAQRSAMKAKVGLWSIERDSEDYYLAVEGSYRFHRPGCARISRSKPDRLRRLDHRDEAFYEGLSPCRFCRP